MEFGYVIYEYDPVARKYFISNSSQQNASLFVLNGVLEKEGNQFNIAVADDPSHEVLSPKNFAFRIGIKPNAVQQSIQLGVGFGRSVMKVWGASQR